MCIRKLEDGPLKEKSLPFEVSPVYPSVRQNRLRVLSSVEHSRSHKFQIAFCVLNLIRKIQLLDEYLQCESETRALDANNKCFYHSSLSLSRCITITVFLVIWGIDILIKLYLHIAYYDKSISSLGQ